MDRRQGFRWFKDDVCDRCGECLQSCPVLGLSGPGARADIQALIAGEVKDATAFQFCNTCNACDLACPKDADPYELVLENFNDYGQNHGLPYLAKMILPNEPENLWSALRVVMDPDELSMLRTWEEGLHTPKKEILLTGMYTSLVPRLTGAKILDDLRPVMVGCEGLWGCGGDSNKLGAIGPTEQVVALLERQFRDMGVERVYCFMETEAAMLAEVLPQRFGADFSVEALPLDYWVLEQLEQGNVEVTRKLNLRATVHDNCLSRYFGGRPQEVVRKIVEIAGCDLVEMKHHRSKALCCGWAATIPTLYGATSGNPMRTVIHLFHSLDLRLQEALETGADILVASCPACYVFLSVIKELTNARIDVYHPLEIVETATGGTRFPKIPERCWEILAIATDLGIRWAVSGENRRRFLPKPIDPSRVAPVPQVSPDDARRISALARFYKGPIVQNRLTRTLTGAIIRACIAAYRSSLRRTLRHRRA